MSRLADIYFSLRDFLTVKQLSSFQKNRLRVTLTKTLTPVLQLLTLVSLVSVAFGGIVSSAVYRGESLNAAISWSIYSGFSVMCFLIPISVSKQARKWLNELFCLSLALVSTFSGIYLGSVDEPHSAAIYVVYILPLWSLPLPSPLIKRLLINASVYLIFPGLIFVVGIQGSQLWMVFSIVTGSVLLSLVLGHSFYLNLRSNYITKRNIEKSQKELETLHENLHEEKRKADEFLLNIIPEHVTDQLKHKDIFVAESYDQAGVIFADIVDFTPVADRLDPKQVVRILHSIFSRFDDLISDFKAEKIKTIGDEYFAVTGIPNQTKNPIVEAIDLALAMRKLLVDFRSSEGLDFQLRIGVNSGPITGGIIGTEKYVYDVWGQTVNVGSRMESNGVPGKIQVTESAMNSINPDIRSQYDFTKRGKIDIKGHEKITTYFVESSDEAVSP